MKIKKMILNLFEKLLTVLTENNKERLKSSKKFVNAKINFCSPFG